MPNEPFRGNGEEELAIGAEGVITKYARTDDDLWEQIPNNEGRNVEPIEWERRDDDSLEWGKHQDDDYYPDDHFSIKATDEEKDEFDPKQTKDETDEKVKRNNDESDDIETQ